MSDKNFLYRLNYLADSDDTNPDEYLSDIQVQMGDVIFVENGFYHAVVAVDHIPESVESMVTQPALTLSESSQPPEEARLVAMQYGHLSPSLWPYLLQPGG